MAQSEDYLTNVEGIGLSSDLRDLIARARQIGETSIGPSARSVDEGRKFPREAMAALHASGLTALYVPKVEDGAGLDPLASILPQVLIAMEVSAWCSSTSQVYGAHCAVLRQIGVLGDATLKRFFHREAVEGRFFASFGAEANADRFALGSRIEADGADYRLNGRKHFATSSTGSSWAMWLSLASDNTLKLPLVDLRGEGITIVDNWAGIGQRGTGSGVAVAENTSVPASFVMETSNPAFRMAFFENITNLVFAAQFAGIAMGAYRTALAHVRERTRPWRGLESASKDPFIRLRVAEMAIKINAARQLVIHAARVFEHHAQNPEFDALSGVATAQAKVIATEAALDVTSTIFQVMGASSATTTHGFDRYFRDARTLTLHDPVDRRRELIGMFDLGSDQDDLSIAPSAPATAAESAA
jgi:alkylation response protein AidB-like acyl-CoA dehydrogenase